MEIKWEHWRGRMVPVDERSRMAEMAIRSAKDCHGVGYCLSGDTLVMAVITEEGIEVWDCAIRRHGEPSKARP